METLEQYNARIARTTKNSLIDRLHNYNNERTQLIMATVIPADKITMLLGTTRERGAYLRVADKLMASDDPAWDVTDDFPGKNLNSVKQGFVNVINNPKNPHLTGKMRVVVSDERVYLIKL